MSTSPLPLQNLSPPHILADGSPHIQLSAANASSNSTANQSSTLSKLSISQIAANITYSTKSFIKTSLKFLKYWFRPLACLAVYIFTVHTAWTAPNQNALLGRVRASFGTWLLAIFAKAGDLCFAFAIEDTFDVIAWRKLKARKRNDDVVTLEWFLSVISSTGLEGLIRLLWRKFRRWVVRMVRVSRTPGLPGSEVEESREQRWRRWLRSGRNARWTFARLLCLIVLIPGPGIILMGTLYLPVLLDIQLMMFNSRYRSNNSLLRREINECFCRSRDFRPKHSECFTSHHCTNCLALHPSHAAGSLVIMAS